MWEQQNQSDTPVEVGALTCGVSLCLWLKSKCQQAGFCVCFPVIRLPSCCGTVDAGRIFCCPAYLQTAGGDIGFPSAPLPAKRLSAATFKLLASKVRQQLLQEPDSGPQVSVSISERAHKQVSIRISSFWAPLAVNSVAAVIENKQFVLEWRKTDFIQRLNFLKCSQCTLIGALHFLSTFLLFLLDYLAAAQLSNLSLFDGWTKTRSLVLFP